MADINLAVGTSIAAAVGRGRATLAAAGCETPWLDAELLLAEVLGVGREWLVLDHARILEVAERRHYGELLVRRARREPVAYILGRRDFRRLTLTVNPRVLIPRPETELLVEVALELSPGVRVADVGTGSGAVALALADERPDLIVRGLDLSAAALEVARANRDRLGLSVELVQADLLDGERYDAVLANLPYVAHGAVLEPEIARYEPPEALFAGPDGLRAVRALISLVAARGRPLPLLALEIGPQQASAVVALLRSAGYDDVDIRPDLAGHERVAVGRR